MYVYVAIQLNNCITIGEGKTSQSLGDQIIASGGVVLSEFPTDVSKPFHACYHTYIFNMCKQVCPSKTFLLADKPRRTAKYLLALAGGVPCVRPSWAKDCLKQVRTYLKLRSLMENLTTMLYT